MVVWGFVRRGSSDVAISHGGRDLWGGSLGGSGLTLAVTLSQWPGN